MGRSVHSETPHSFANSGKGTASSPLGSGMRGRGLPFGRGGRPGFRLLRWVAPRVSTRDGVGVSGHVSGSNFLSPVALAAPARGDARSLVNGLTEQAATLLTARGAPPDTGVVNGLTEKTRCAINAPAGPQYTPGKSASCPHANSLVNAVTPEGSGPRPSAKPRSSTRRPCSSPGRHLWIRRRRCNSLPIRWYLTI
jgi:hypothetical protein